MPKRTSPAAGPAPPPAADTPPVRLDVVGTTGGKATVETLSAGAALGPASEVGHVAAMTQPILHAADLSLTSPLTELRPDPENRRQRTDRGRQMIAASLRETGAGRSIVIDENNQVLAGNGVVEAAPGAGIDRVRIIDAEGDELIAVRRRNLSPEQKRSLAIFDNRTAELAEWNPEQLAADRAAGLGLQPFWTPEEETALASKWAEAEVGAMAADGEPGAGEPGHRRGANTAGDYQTFAVPLTVDQEREVRAALRTARRVYQVTTAGDALAAALAAWVKTQEG